MAADGDIPEPEGSISSLLTDSLKSEEGGDALSPEEIAWVDSCLVKDPDVLDGDWSSMKDALIEILGLQPESLNPSPPGSDGLSKGMDIEMLPSTEPEIVTTSGRTNDDGSNKINEEVEENNDDFSVEEEAGVSLSEQLQGDPPESSLKDAFLPNYREDNQNMGESVASELDTDSSTFQLEPLTQDIFKVWDLGIPSEEDELVKQLNKALSESSVESVPPLADDSGAWKDAKDESVDDLIAGILDLSLNEDSK